ncbi:MAG: hypothetical protein GY835_10020, partial [bacterium]|nr:hypothetical protein [bacterium]
AAVKKILSMFSPVSGLIAIIQSIWNVIQFVIEKARQIMMLAAAVFGTLAPLVKGDVKKAADQVERALSIVLPLALGFLAGLLGLGKLAGYIVKVMKKFGAYVLKIIKKVVNMIAKMFKKLFGKGRRGKALKDPKLEKKRQKKAMRDMITAVDNLKGPKKRLFGKERKAVTREQVLKLLKKKKRKHGFSVLRVATPKGQQKIVIEAGFSPTEKKEAKDTAFEAEDGVITIDNKRIKIPERKPGNKPVEAGYAVIVSASFQTGDRWGVAAALAVDQIPALTKKEKRKSMEARVRELGSLIFTNNSEFSQANEILHLHQKAAGNTANRRVGIAKFENQPPLNFLLGKAKEINDACPAGSKLFKGGIKKTSFGTQWVADLMEYADVEWEKVKSTFVSRVIGEEDEQAKKDLDDWLNKTIRMPVGHRYALIWGKKGGSDHHLPFHFTAAELVEELKRLASDTSRIPVRIGDPVAGESARGVPDLVEFWNRNFPIADKGRTGQLRLFRHMVSRKYEAVNLGMRSGAMEAPTLAGMQTIYFEEKTSESARRMEQWLRNIPNFHRVILEFPPGEKQRREYLVYLDKYKIAKADNVARWRRNLELMAAGAYSGVQDPRFHSALAGKGEGEKGGVYEKFQEKYQGHLKKFEAYMKLKKRIAEELKSPFQGIKTKESRAVRWMLERDSAQLNKLQEKLQQEFAQLADSDPGVLAVKSPEMS